MINAIKSLWQRLAPGFILSFVRFILEPADYTERRKAVLSFYKKIPQKELAPEISEGLKYLKWNKYTPFPYYWAKKYENIVPEIFSDEQTKHLYVMYEGKRMYFPGNFSRQAVTWSVRAARREQDPQSPHLYLTDEFQPVEDSIIIDAGVAEGNFSLSVVEKAKRLYLIECDPGWMEALRLTFAPWKEKVVLVEKFMSDSPGETTTSVDSLLDESELGSVFIKLDIEGYEQKAIQGMDKLLKSGRPLKMDVCTYHHPGDFAEIKALLENSGLSCKATEGMVLFFQKGEEPSFRKVLIRAEKS
jgi:hypothetical protein